MGKVYYFLGKNKNLSILKSLLRHILSRRCWKNQGERGHQFYRVRKSLLGQFSQGVQVPEMKIPHSCKLIGAHAAAGALTGVYCTKQRPGSNAKCIDAKCTNAKCPTDAECLGMHKGTEKSPGASGSPCLDVLEKTPIAPTRCNVISATSLHSPAAYGVRTHRPNQEHWLPSGVRTPVPPPLQSPTAVLCHP